jgi:chemotaxis protein methyltransferase CheR
MLSNEEAPPHSDLEALEISLLLEGIYKHCGLDFRSYALSSLRRRLRYHMKEIGLTSISGLQEHILHKGASMERLLGNLSINVTSMFRDPGFYKVLREKILPYLRTYSFIRIWHAGCATGEEVYSLAILLREEKIYERCRIYATDMNEAVLEKAKSGIFPISAMKEYSSKYLKAGGKSSLSNYYTAKYSNVIFDASLLKNVVFARHNLAMEGSFNEFNVILCRNVMIYFNCELQEKVHELLKESLCLLGYLGIGARESLGYCPHEMDFENIDEQSRLYRRVR